MRNPLIVALDVPDADRALALAARLAPVVGAVKVGLELFTAAGPDIVRRLRAAGAAVFLDLKLHDIPHTVARAVESAVRLDVQMLTVHTSGGRAMLAAAEQAARAGAQRRGQAPPLVLGVTVLTSLDDAALAEVGAAAGAAAQVERLARLAVSAGLRGLVCSPLELPALRAALPREIQLVTPGIRPPGTDAGDQKRTLGPREALAAGADWLVVGRPILAAPDPRAAAEQILAALA
jgi:orotidine-5'-phosphate decarboxylase